MNVVVTINNFFYNNMIYQIIFILTFIIIILFISFKPKNNNENFDCSSCTTEIKTKINNLKGDKGPTGNNTNNVQNGYNCSICKGCSQYDEDQCLLGKTQEFSPIDVSTPIVPPGNPSRCAAIDPSILSLHNGPVIRTRVVCKPSGPFGIDGVEGEVGDEGDEGIIGEEGPIGDTQKTQFNCRTCFGRKENCNIRCSNPYMSYINESKDCYDTGKTVPLFEGSSPEKIFSKVICTTPSNIGDPGVIGEEGPDGLNGEIGPIGEEGDDGEDISLKLNGEYYSLPDTISRENTRWDVGRYDGDLAWAGISDGNKTKKYKRNTNTSNIPKYSGYVIPNILDKLDIDSTSSGPQGHLQKKNGTCTINSDIFELVRRDAKCHGKEKKRLGYVSSASQCAESCKKNGGKYFIFGKGKQKGQCYIESVKNDKCGSYGINPISDYDLYKIKSELELDTGCFLQYNGEIEALDYKNSLPYKEPLSIGKTYLSIHEFDVLKKFLKYY